MKELIMITKKGSYVESKKAVEMKVGKCGIYFTFRKVLSVHEYVCFGIYGNRLYFKPCKQDEGWKLVQKGSKNKDTKYVSVTNNKQNKRLTDFVTTYAGSYDMEYDNELKAYYVSGISTVTKGIDNGKEKEK